MSGDGIGGQRSAALVWNMRQAHVEFVCNLAHGEMGETAHGARTIVHRPFLFLRRGDYIGKAFVFARGMRGDAIGDVPISMTGARSRSVSNGRLGNRLGLSAWLSNTSRKVVPSGGEVTAAWVPMEP